MRMYFKEKIKVTHHLIIADLVLDFVLLLFMQLYSPKQIVFREFSNMENNQLSDHHSSARDHN